MSEETSIHPEPVPESDTVATEDHPSTPLTSLPLTKARSWVPQKRLRTLADQAIKVVDRNADKDPTIAAAGAGLTWVATAFKDVYDASRTKSTNAQREQLELAQAIEPLQRATQAWVGVMITALPDFQAKAFSNGDRRPRGIIADAERLIEVVRSHQAGPAEPLPFGDQLLANLTPLVEQAKRELEDVDALHSKNAEMHQQVRSLAVALQRNLVGLRRCLRAVLGSSHPDYRALSLAPGKRTGDDDIEVIDEDGTPADGVES